MAGCECRHICSQYRRNAYEREPGKVEDICTIQSGEKRDCDLYQFLSGEAEPGEGYILNERQRRRPKLIVRAKSIFGIRFWKEFNEYLGQQMNYNLIKRQNF